MLPQGCVERCPGCSHRALSRAESETRKQAWLARALAPWAAVLRPLVGSDHRWGYRERACLRAEWAGSRWRFGLLCNDEVIEIPDCPVHSERARAILKFASARLPGPDRLPLAFAVVAGELLVLVVKAHEVSDLSWIEQADVASWGSRGVYLNLNPSAGDRVFASKAWQKVWGDDSGVLSVLGHELSYGPSSFQQLQPRLYERALGEARDFLAPDSGAQVIDLCSGLGASLQLWRDSGARVIGVELSGEAVEHAERRLAQEVRVLRGKASHRIPQLEEWVRPGRTLVFANPPRLGLEAEVTDWIGERLRPERLAYLSCSAGTLARDLDLLVRTGYAVRKITPYDFFPQTHHVEALACLELPSADRLRGAPDARSDAGFDR